MLDLSKKPAQPLIAPSALASDFANMADDCRLSLEAGGDLLHIDVMDGHFVPTITMGPQMVQSLHRNLPGVMLDCHLMVEDPGKFIDDFAAAGAHVISFHLEVCFPFHPSGHNPGLLIQRIQQHGMKAGMVINPNTPAEPLTPWLEELDLVLVMSVVPGAGGQAFMPHVLDKVRWLKQRVPDTCRIEMDGGLSLDTAGDAIDAGCEILVAGSAIFSREMAAQRAATIEGMPH